MQINIKAKSIFVCPIRSFVYGLRGIGNRIVSVIH